MVSADTQATSSNLPPPESSDSSKLSRKRERELSAEPGHTGNDEKSPPVALGTQKEDKAPMKKNKVRASETEGYSKEYAEDITSKSPSKSPTSEPEADQRDKSLDAAGISSSNSAQNDDAHNRTSDVQSKESTGIISPGLGSPQGTALEVGKDIGTKRKLEDRARSEDPCDDTSKKPASIGVVKRAKESETNSDDGVKGSDHLKRSREDADKDDNPRETKRPTPPPADKPAPSGGFMSYASTSSPFAAVKGPNIFSGKQNKPKSPPTHKESAGTSKPTSGPSSSLFSDGKTLPSSSTWGSYTPQKTAPRSKVDAFSAYVSSGAHGFTPFAKQRQGSPKTSGADDSKVRDESQSVEEGDKPSTFGERLRAAQDTEEDVEAGQEHGKVVLEKQEVHTGEEEEETIHQVRGKLFTLADGAWKEKGTGQLRLNVRAVDGTGPRLVMRKEAVLSVILNVTLFRGMRCVLAQDPRYIRFSVIENGATVHYSLKLANTKIANELLEEIQANIPS